MSTIYHIFSHIFAVSCTYTTTFSQYGDTTTFSIQQLFVYNNFLAVTLANVGIHIGDVSDFDFLRFGVFVVA